MKKIKIGIIICDRYRNCGGGKCFRALKNREGAFDIYSKDDHVEIVGYANCGDCPGGNLEYVPEEMKKNGAQLIHFATGFVVGYPPCPYIKHHKEMIRVKYKMKVIVGTHPIPQKYFAIHSTLGTWESRELSDFIRPTLASEKLRLLYD
ncbi:MAG: CGGC domain-containing protein [Candidatus Scalindua sp.]|nr:CGGC domain-containing protein [Candidatus Scalindua sp.]